MNITLRTDDLTRLIELQREFLTHLGRSSAAVGLVSDDVIRAAGGQPVNVAAWERKHRQLTARVKA